jgi:hypothetical protein
MIPKPTTDEAESRLLDLIDEYWGIAYTEGKEGRTRDNETSDAGRKWAEIRAALASLKAPAAEGWMPIESAPTSEAEPFLVLRRGIAVQVSWFEGRLYPDALEACVDFDDGITDATHWQARPHLPKEKT